MLKLRWMASLEEAEFWSLSPALKCNGRVGKCPCVWFQNHYSWFAKQLLHDCQKQVKLGCNQWQVNVAQLPLTLELKQTFNQLCYYGTNVLPSPPFIFIPDFSKHGAYYQSYHFSMFAYQSPAGRIKYSYNLWIPHRTANILMCLWTQTWVMNKTDFRAGLPRAKEK